MKAGIAVVFTLFYLAAAAQAQESFSVHGSTVLYTRPNAASWRLVKNEMDPKSNIFLLMFEHNPIEDSQGRRIRPVIALICEPVKDSSNVVEYSIRKRVHVPFNAKAMLTPQKGHFRYPASVGYEGEYDKGVLHKVFVAHMRHKDVGVQIICDTTEGVYGKVEADMRSFLRSVTFKE